MKLTFNDLLTLSKLIEAQGENATEDQRNIYTEIRKEIRRRNS